MMNDSTRVKRRPRRAMNDSTRPENVVLTGAVDAVTTARLDHHIVQCRTPSSRTDPDGESST
jgi:hypothetical protein